MATLDTDELAKKTMETIAVLARLPVVRVDREAFLRKQFAKSPILIRYSRMARRAYTRLIR